ncbi:hypothetical protein F4776DRAFT_666777 [Hypoxylon sp. NC0597]|nr:hypothetical protein F4776DRAFT_666777 [Hypoxylon sp. NC0597]
MNSSQNKSANTAEKPADSITKNPNTSDSPSSIDGIDLLRLAASRNTAIGNISRLNSGSMVASNSSNTPILPPELPVLSRPEPAVLRYQAIFNQASRQSSRNSHVISSIAPARIDSPSQPRTPERISGLQPGVPPRVQRPDQDNIRRGPYTVSRFELNRSEAMSRGGRISRNDNIRVTPTPKPAPLPYGLDQIYAENRRISAEAKRAEDEKTRQAAESRRIEAEIKAASRWPGDTSSYPAQATEDIAVPNSELRAKAIHVGTPVTENSPLIGVYAIRPPFSPKIEFRMAQDSSPPEEIFRGHLVEFQNIRLNQYFQNMNESQAELWIRHLLASVPGKNNTLMKWT